MHNVKVTVIDVGSVPVLAVATVADAVTQPVAVPPHDPGVVGFATVIVAYVVVVEAWATPGSASTAAAVSSAASAV